MEPKPILLWNCTHFRHPTEEQLRHVDIFFSSYYNLQSVHFEYMYVSVWTVIDVWNALPVYLNKDQHIDCHVYQVVLFLFQCNLVTPSCIFCFLMVSILPCLNILGQFIGILHVIIHIHLPAFFVFWWSLYFHVWIY